MSLDIPAIQASLREEGLDGWLLYDFHGSNPIARHLAGLDGHGKMTTRRWYYLVPADGEPRGVVHAIERHNLDHLPGRKVVYAGRHQQEHAIRDVLDGCRRVAMEYSPGCAIPYISRVDGGTLDLIRQLGVEVVSSGDLVQRFEAIWDRDALESHRGASERLYRMKDGALEAIARATRGGGSTTEYEIQRLMAGWFRDEGLISDSDPVVAAQENAGNPHYLPTLERHRTIRGDELVLLDLWGKLEGPGTVFADITWVGFTGRRIPDEMARAFEAVRQARDAAIALVQGAAEARGELRGWEVDRAARSVLEGAGYRDQILHRTGHSLGQDVHGNGVHMDDYETHDDRRLLPGTGFTIEPGLYFDSFGVRTEINMLYGEGTATVTGPKQGAIVPLV
ncbi:MAG: aminopeptidase P family protein [Acidobacteria bacterium]|nr:aminopeptidase P family protein [Acidobacteriota bacterium]